jgi:hypothetical protein
MQNDLFPVDVPSVLDYGIDKWHEEFFWPVSEPAFAQLFGTVESWYLAAVKDAQQPIKDFLVIHYKLISGLANYLHARMAVAAIQQRKQQPLYHQNSVSYRQVIEGKIHLNDFWESARPRHPGFGQQLTLQMKQSLKYWLWNVRRHPIKDHRDKAVLLGYPTPLISEFIQQKSYWMKSVRDYELFPESIWAEEIPGDLSSQIRDFARQFIRQLKEALQKNIPLALSDVEQERLSTIIALLLSQTARLFFSVSRRQWKKNRLLLVSGEGNLYRRIVVKAFREQGGQAVGFIHGYDVGWRRQPVYSQMIMTMLDKLVTYTPASVQLYERLRGEFPPPNDNPCEVVSTNTRYFSNCWQQRSAVPSQIKTIMLIGYPFYHYRARRAAFPLFHLDVEWRIINLLKAWGYEVIYKMHPDRIYKTLTFGPGVEVITQPFEQVMDRGDCLLYVHSGTSTFGTALCSNKPIVCMKGPWDEWYPEPYALLRKRCRVVQLGFDERNRLSFSAQELREALALPVTQPDTGFMETYLF